MRVPRRECVFGPGLERCVAVRGRGFGGGEGGGVICRRLLLESVAADFHTVRAGHHLGRRGHEKQLFRRGHETKNKLILFDETFCLVGSLRGTRAADEVRTEIADTRFPPYRRDPFPSDAVYGNSESLIVSLSVARRPPYEFYMIHHRLALPRD